jgi:hypothetical protein
VPSSCLALPPKPTLDLNICRLILSEMLRFTEGTKRLAQVGMYNGGWRIKVSPYPLAIRDEEFKQVDYPGGGSSPSQKPAPRNSWDRDTRMIQRMAFSFVPMV